MAIHTHRTINRLTSNHLLILLSLLAIINFVQSRQYPNQHLNIEEILWPKVEKILHGNNKDVQLQIFISTWEDNGLHIHNTNNVNARNYVTRVYKQFNESMHHIISSPEYQRVNYKSFRKSNNNNNNNNNNANVNTNEKQSSQHEVIILQMKINVNFMHSNENPQEFGDMTNTQLDRQEWSNYEHTLQHGHYDESYKLNLEIKKINANNNILQIDVASATVFGISHAFTTLKQLFVNGNAMKSSSTIQGDNKNNAKLMLHSNYLPLKIEDKPTLEYRGLLIDTSRHYIPVSQILKIIDGLSLLKLNVLHWHMIDSQSFPFESKKFPKLSQHGAYHSKQAIYTHNDIRKIISYAFYRGVEVIPEIDVPGHAASWGIAYPEIIVDCPTRVGTDDRLLEHGLDKIALNVLKNKTYEIVYGVLDEISNLFPSKRIHLGGDEIDGDCWLNDPLIKEFKRKHGSNQWKNKLHSMFLLKVANYIIENYDKKIILWDEALDLPALLPRGRKNSEIYIQVWRWWLPNQSRRAQRKGYKTITSIGYYLDYINTKWEEMYDRSIATENIGGEACSWHEHADTATIEHRIFQRLPVVAERFWSTAAATKRNDRTLPRLAWIICRLKKLIRLNVASVFPDFCPTSFLSDDTQQHLPLNEQEEL